MITKPAATAMPIVAPVLIPSLPLYVPVSSDAVDPTPPAGTSLLAMPAPGDGVGVEGASAEEAAAPVRVAKPVD